MLTANIHFIENKASKKHKDVLDAPTLLLVFASFA